MLTGIRTGYGVSVSSGVSNGVSSGVSTSVSTKVALGTGRKWPRCVVEVSSITGLCRIRGINMGAFLDIISVELPKNGESGSLVLKLPPRKIYGGQGRPQTTAPTEIFVLALDEVLDNYSLECRMITSYEIRAKPLKVEEVLKIFDKDNVTLVT